MKKIYWRPRNVSRTALVLISLIALGGLLLVEFHPVGIKQRYFDQKQAAATLAAKCMERIKERRVELGHEINPDTDPTESGLIGLATSSVTSTHGFLPAKQVSVNPNFAAAIVEMLKRAGVESGDTVAVGYSGSFPAINVCVVAALETLKVKPIGISSAASSQWGANFEDLLWIDMEQLLSEEKLISFHSVAASLGGIEDRGVGMDQETLGALQAGIERCGLPMVAAPDPSLTDPIEAFTRSVDKRMELYAKKAAGARIKAYINVGGGTTSVGKTLGKKMLGAGLNRTLPKSARDIDSVMTRFLQRDVPVIHLVRVTDLAKRYGLSIDPERTSLPEVGEGTVFYRQEYNQWYAGGVLAAIVASLYAFIRSDWGFRLFQFGNRQKEAGHPEPMV